MFKQWQCVMDPPLPVSLGIISSPPFAACVIEVPMLDTTGLHKVVARLSLCGVPLFIVVEATDVRATVAAAKATVVGDM